ncbi:hypothetical protein [Thalassospira sp.]|uniref:DUF7684 family protein n=1 Tax=Thalassospira sp. TaxID=1912094 RepID=UPI00311E957A
MNRTSIGSTEIIVASDLDTFPATSDEICSAVFLESEAIKNYTQTMLKSCFENMMIKGCSLFVTIGDGSERIHDFIDDIILDLSERDLLPSKSPVLTTFHATDEYDDAVSILFCNKNTLENEQMRILAVAGDKGNKFISAIKDFSAPKVF